MITVAQQSQVLLNLWALQRKLSDCRDELRGADCMDYVGALSDLQADLSVRIKRLKAQLLDE